MEMDNVEQRMNGSGPGVLDYIAAGGSEGPGLPGAAPAPKTPPKENAEEQVPHLTRVPVQRPDDLYPTAGGTGRMTKFMDNVRVWHQPGEDADIADPVSPAKGGLYMDCQRLDVLTRRWTARTGRRCSPTAAPTSSASRRTNSTEMPRRSSTTRPRRSSSSRALRPRCTSYPRSRAASAETLQGGKLLYNKKTGLFKLDKVNVISSWLLPRERPAVLDPLAMAGRPVPDPFSGEPPATASRNAVPTPDLFLGHGRLAAPR